MAIFPLLTLTVLFATALPVLAADVPGVGGTDYSVRVTSIKQARQAVTSTSITFKQPVRPETRAACAAQQICTRRELDSKRARKHLPAAPRIAGFCSTRGTRRTADVEQCCTACISGIDSRRP
jgi:hypothetical protein